MQKGFPTVSRMGLGCWAFGGGAYWGRQSQRDVDEVVRAAVDAGINFFDTARMYNDGASEASLGLAMRGLRDRCVVCSKVSPAKAYYDALKRECNASLAALGTDYIDIYMLHWPINAPGIKHFTDDPAVLAVPPTAGEAFAALADLKKDGKVRAIGISNFGVRQMEEALAICPDIVVNEMPYNIVSRAIEAEIAPFCREKGMAVVASMTLQQGVLAGIYATAGEVPPHQAHSRHFARERGQGTSRHNEAGAEQEVFATVDLLRALAKQLGLSVAQLSIAWVLAKPFISSALVGARNAVELMENARAMRMALPAEAIKQIDDASEKVLARLGHNPDYYENGTESRIY